MELEIRCQRNDTHGGPVGSDGTVPVPWSGPGITPTIKYHEVEVVRSEVVSPLYRETSSRS